MKRGEEKGGRGKFSNFLLLLLLPQKLLQRHVDSHFATDEENNDKNKKKKKKKKRDGSSGREEEEAAGGAVRAGGAGAKGSVGGAGTARKSVWRSAAGAWAGAWPAWAWPGGPLRGSCPRKSAGALQRRMLASSESSRRLRRAGVRLRRRESPFSARNFDFFDAGVMAGLRSAVGRLEAAPGAAGAPPGPAGTGEARVRRVLARRADPDTGETMALVRWTPEGV